MCAADNVRGLRPVGALLHARAVLKQRWSVSAEISLGSPFTPRLIITQDARRDAYTRGAAGSVQKSAGRKRVVCQFGDGPQYHV